LFSGVLNCGDHSIVIGDSHRAEADVVLLRLTLRDAATWSVRTVEVEGEPETTVASLVAALPLASSDRPCFVGDQLLDPTATLAQSPVLPGVTLNVGGPGPDPRRAPAGAVGVVRLLAGPQAPATFWLSPGEHQLARSADASVPLNDPEVSRCHAGLVVSGDGSATVADLGSTYGTWLDGAAVTGPVPLPAGRMLTLGQARLDWVPLPPRPLHTRRSQDARLDFDRAFSPTPALVPTRVELPEPVPEPGSAGGRAALITSALTPLLLGVVGAALTRQPAMLGMALLAPASALTIRHLERRSHKARVAAAERNREATRRRLSELVAAQERQARAAAFDPLTITLAATGWSTGLWPRNAVGSDGLVLRLGTGDAPAAVELSGTAWPGLEAPLLRDVPVTVDLRAAGVLALVGPESVISGSVRWLLAQLATLRSPDDLRLVIITASDEPELAWAQWLPHLDAGALGDLPCALGNTPLTRAARVAELRDLISARQAQLATGGFGASRGLGAGLGSGAPGAGAGFADEVVVVLDGALGLRHLPGMKALLRDGPGVGVYVIAADRAGLHEAGAECMVGTEEDGVGIEEDGAGNEEDGAGGPPALLTRSRTDQPVPVRLDRLDRAEAERIARCLAPMRDRLTLAGADAAVPYPVRFLDVLGLDVPTVDDVAGLWQEQPGPTTRVVLGADGSGPVVVDLADQGPHTMLGGATGAGKSILLQTLVTSLLLANRPDELNLILVDFKGGSAFLPFAACPHVVALIRSTGETPADVFDEAAAQRVLASVRAEVRRRESMLARFGGELEEYWRARRSDPALGPLPRLVMVFDEFARVLDTSPDFLTELVNVAAKGRSLGMHLVLATQSLQGKLSPELKNTIDLRITLRQNEVADSVEVLGVADAAAIPGRLRGRGLILCTKDETRTPRVFQSGYLGNPPPAGGTPPARVRVVEWPALGLPRPADPPAPSGADTDQELTIRAIEQVCAKSGLRAPFTPLRPPLPAALPLAELDRWASAPAPASAVPFGLRDAPDAQAQPPAVLDLAGTDRLLVAGGPQSGRTTLARVLLAGLGTRFRPDEVHVYVLEHRPSGLAGLAGAQRLPHCGAVIAGNQPDRIRRLVTWLDAEVTRRAATGSARPWVVVLVDGWELFENRADPNFQETSLLTLIRGVITAGPPVGVHVVPFGGLDLLNGKLPGLFTQRVLLPFPDEQTRRAHLGSRGVVPPQLPGRAVDAGSGLHLQVCDPGPGEILGPGVGNPVLRPRTFPPLPVRLRVADLPVADLPVADLPVADLPVADLPDRCPAWVPLGVGGPDVVPVGIDLFDAGPHLLLVSGTAGTGRSTAAATIVRGLRAAGTGVLAVAPPRSPLPGMLPADDGIRVVTGTTVQDGELREAVAPFGGGRYAVVLDDCEQLNVVAVQENWEDKPTLLADIAAPGSLGRAALVLCGDAQPILSGQRRSLSRVVGEIMTAGARLLLCPTVPVSARELGFRLEPDQFFPAPPGRGHLAVGREVSLIQVAEPR
jgi:S-DNA-T family DNA segregation ATPase FtsK/SpoIIIE